MCVLPLPASTTSLRARANADALSASQLQEFGSTYESEVLRNKKKLELADVLVFVYDSSDTNSFSYVSNLRVRPPPLVSKSSCLST